MYDWGTATVKQDLYKARELHLKAARLGSLGSLYNYASMCEQGDGGSIDLPSAIKWYKIADIRGQSRATTNLGGMYESGTGVLQNYERAAELFKKAADAGQGNAMYRLASMYLEGRGVKQSYSSARELCLKSSKIQSVAQQDAIRRLASIDKGCSFCFTPLPLNHTNVNMMFSSNFSVVSFHLPTAQTVVTRNCKCNAARYCNDVCTCETPSCQCFHNILLFVFIFISYTYWNFLSILSFLLFCFFCFLVFLFFFGQAKKNTGNTTKKHIGESVGKIQTIKICFVVSVRSKLKKTTILFG